MKKQKTKNQRKTKKEKKNHGPMSYLCFHIEINFNMLEINFNILCQLIIILYYITCIYLLINYFKEINFNVLLI